MKLHRSIAVAVMLIGTSAHSIEVSRRNLLKGVATATFFNPLKTGFNLGSNRSEAILEIPEYTSKQSNSGNIEVGYRMTRTEDYDICDYALRNPMSIYDNSARRLIDFRQTPLLSQARKILHAEQPVSHSDPNRNVEIPTKDSISVTQEIHQLLSDKQVVAILGSSQIDKDNPFYSLAYDLAHRLGSQGFTVLTGGGPGVLDAAYIGAKAAGALSIGFEVNTPWPRHLTDPIDRLFVFDDLQIRKKVIMTVSGAFVFLPGGFGSLDELFTVVGAMYSGQMPKKPLILVGKAFWEPLLEYLRMLLVREFHTVKISDFDFIQIVDTAGEVSNLLTPEFFN